jgi:hypothetical protein
VDVFRGKSSSSDTEPIRVWRVEQTSAALFTLNPSQHRTKKAGYGKKTERRKERKKEKKKRGEKKQTADLETSEIASLFLPALSL